MSREKRIKHSNNYQAANKTVIKKSDSTEN